MKDEQKFDRERRKRVQNFRVNISEDDLKGEIPDTVISSYSDPAKAERVRETTEAAASSRAQLAHKLRSEEKGGRNKGFFRMMWLCMVLMLSVLAGKYLVVGINDMLAVGRQAVNVTVDIPKHATSKQVAQIFYHSGAIQDPDFFLFFSKMTKAPQTYGGGSYQISTSMDYEALINAIESNEKRVDTVKVTFSEGMNAPEIAAKLEKNGVCSAADALQAFNTDKLNNDYDFIGALKNNNVRYYKLEGYLFPDTYEFFKNEDADDVVDKMINNCSNKLTKQIRDKAKAKNMTVDQLMTLASMIQAEAADKEDMYNVSSVFHNRLESGSSSLEHLDSDPTTFYPYRQQALVPAAQRKTYKSRYDTYTVKGLPAGAVCNPGLDAIDAALNPADTSYYYFCHSKKGEAYYARTLAGHEENLKEAGLK